MIDKNGHLKLSDFGLSTGLHKNTDGDYYKRLLEQDKQRDSTRNSVQVNAIHLTMSREQIATWKANRRKLVRPVHASCVLHLTYPRYQGLFYSWYASNGVEFRVLTYIFHPRHPRLHRAGGLHAKRVRKGM